MSFWVRVGSGFRPSADTPDHKDLPGFKSLAGSKSEVIICVQKFLNEIGTNSYGAVI